MSQVRDSIWSRADLTGFPPPTRDGDVQVCVIGAGIIDKVGLAAGETVLDSAHVPLAPEDRSCCLACFLVQGRSR